MTEPAPTQSEDLVAEWLYLSDRAQQIYGGLVGLSDFGHWDSYFARTFDIYTRLWRFQQQHRAILESKDSYGLQRWEIGDIAARIAQLYYHYYLRTGDVSYLQEAYLFYDAVRTRNYYKPGPERSKSSVVGVLVKQLRFYARFVVTCLLLDRRNMVGTLVEELSNLINEYSTAVRGAGETQEWHLVLQEITMFLQADTPITYKMQNATVKARPRRIVFAGRGLNGAPKQVSAPVAGPEPVFTIPASTLRLQSCILVGCHQHQVKFSELTLDMYRMMYSLEREPTDLHMASQSPSIGASSSSIPSSSSTSQPTTNNSGSAGGAAAGGNAGSNTAQSFGTPRSKSNRNSPPANPKKYLLYRPTVSQVILYLASAQRELHSDGALLLYLSADGEAPKSTASGSSSSTPLNAIVPPASPASVSTSSSSIPQGAMTHISVPSFATSIHSSTSSLPGLLQNSGFGVIADPYSAGGVRLKREDSATSVARASGFVSSAGLFPCDIVPFTRRPLLVIVDSDNSHSFLTIGTSFGAPLLVLASPQESPADVPETSQSGGLLTHFLHDPLAAFLFTSNKAIANAVVYEQAAAKIDAISLAIEALLSSTDLPAMVVQFMADDFMRLFVVRFCMAYYVLRLRWGKEVTTDCLPASYPPLSPLILGNSTIATEIKDLAKIVGASSLYS